jgi:hypothetical protein
MILAIDFDQTIHDKANPIPGRRMGLPLQDAKTSLDKLNKRGHRIIIHTVMATTTSGLRAVRDWMDYYDLPYHDITATKPNADWFIDDKAIHFDNWTQAMEELSNG